MLTDILRCSRFFQNNLCAQANISVNPLTPKSDQHAQFLLTINTAQSNEGCEKKGKDQQEANCLHHHHRK